MKIKRHDRGGVFPKAFFYRGYGWEVRDLVVITG